MALPGLGFNEKFDRMIRLLEKIAGDIATNETWKFEQVEVSSDVERLYLEIPQVPHKARLQAEAGSIRFRTDGISPTTEVGHLLRDGDWFELNNEYEVKNFRAVAVEGTAKLNVTYEAPL